MKFIIKLKKISITPMKKQKIYLFLPAIIISISLFIIFLATTKNQQVVKASPGIYLEFRCDENNNKCGDRILVRACVGTGGEKVCTPGFDKIDDLIQAIKEKWGWEEPENWSDLPSLLKCKDYQICTRLAPPPTEWSKIPAYCKCKGKCIEKPKRAGTEECPECGIRDGIDFVNPESGPIFLPAHFDWEKVEGAKSYRWKAVPVAIPGVTYVPSTNTKTIVSDVIRDISHPRNPPTEYTPPSCSLQSGNAYYWKVQPCCDLAGLNCKPWAELDAWPFTTSLAPEPATPSDPDWNNTTSEAETQDIPVILDWCDPPDNTVMLGEGRKGEYYYDQGRGKNITSYKLKLYHINSENQEECHPLLVKDGKCIPKEIIPGSNWPWDKLYSLWEDFTGTYLIENQRYRWQVATCYLSEGKEYCSDYSQKWGFSVGTNIRETELIAPPNNINDAIGLPVTFKWNRAIGINSYNYNIGGHTGTTSANIITFDWPDFELDTVYNWTIQPCTDYAAQNCKDWLDPWQFKITGAPPVLLAPTGTEALSAVIPVKLDWKDVSGAGSYEYRILGGISPVKGVVNVSEVVVDYPDLKLNHVYTWQVRTCAHKDGSVCGKWSNLGAFTTFSMGFPVLIKPSLNAKIEEPEIRFSWKPLKGAKYYEYVIKNKSTGEEIFHKIINSDSITHYSYEFPEVGEYEWRVRGCLDSSCGTGGAGPWSNWRTFNLALTAPPERQGGLVPCGRLYDDPNTPWDEREQCQIKHLFLLIRNILDFLLWKVATILLILALVAVGVMLYISKGETTIILQVKSALKWIVIGYGLILLAWSIVNFLLALAGFRFQIFGHWWELPF